MLISDPNATHLIHLAVQDGQDALTRALRRLPVPVIRVAALAVRPAPALESLRSLAEQAKVWIFASSNAVRCFAPVARDWRWPDCVLTQGPGTQRTLDEFGHPSQAPEPPYDSEAMLAMPIWAEQSVGLVLRISGAQGREWLLGELNQRGFDARAVSAYTRVPVPVLASVRSRLIGMSRPPLVVFTSAEAAQAARAALAETWSKLLTGVALVPSERLAELANAWGFVSVVRADSAAAGDVLAAVLRHLPKLQATE